jgi:pSer/pThr/pTyr-binding forkhead associated (FHA) protein
LSFQRGDTLCPRCGDDLTAVHDTNRVDYQQLSQEQIHQLRTDPFQPEPNTMVLIADSKHFVLPGDRQFVIGRASRYTDAPEIDVDLSQCGAAQKGVSRYHASISRKGSQISITDLGSRNGTCANGTLLTKFQECQLKDNDGLQFGRLVAIIRFR